MIEVVNKPTNTIYPAIGTITGALMNFFIKTMPDKFFNHTYIDTRLTSIERYKSPKKLIGFRTPAIALKPQLEMTDLLLDRHEFIRPISVPFESIEDGIVMKLQFERIKIVTEIRIKVETRAKLYDTMLYLKNNIPFTGQFYLDTGASSKPESTLEFPVPNSILKKIAILKNKYDVVHSSISQHAIEEIVDYLNQNRKEVYFYNYKTNYSSGRKVVNLAYDQALLCRFDGLPEMSSDKDQNSRGNHYLGMRASIEVWVPSAFRLFIDEQSELISTFTKAVSLLKLYNLSDKDLNQYVELRELIKGFTDPDSMTPEIYKTNIFDIVTNPKYNSLITIIADSIRINSDEHRKLVSNMENLLSHQNFTSFISDIRKITGEFFNELNSKEKIEEIIHFSTSDIYQQLPQNLKEYVNSTEYFIDADKKDKYFLDFEKDYYRSSEDVLEQNVYTTAITANRATLHNGFRVFKKQPTDNIVVMKLNKSVSANSIVSLRDNSSRLKLEYIKEIAKAFDTRKSVCRKDFLFTDPLEDVEQDIVFNYSVLGEPSIYNSDGKKLLYRNSFTTELNVLIDSIDLFDEIDIYVKKAIQLHLSLGKHIHEFMDEMLYSRVTLVSDAEYSMNYNNMVLTITKPVYNMSYFIAIYVDEALLNTYIKKIYAEEIQ